MTNEKRLLRKLRLRLAATEVIADILKRGLYPHAENEYKKDLVACLDELGNLLIELNASGYFKGVDNESRKH